MNATIGALILQIVQFVVKLIENACNGDEEALQKLCNFVPDSMKTEIVAKVQDELDARKFGQKS